MQKHSSAFFFSFYKKARRESVKLIYSNKAAAHLFKRTGKIFFIVQLYDQDSRQLEVCWSDNVSYYLC